MNNLAQLGLLIGFTWGAAGIVGYPGVQWKQGAVLAGVSLAWLIGHNALPPNELVEGLAFLIFIALSIARDRLYPTKEKQGQGSALDPQGGSGPLDPTT